MIQDDVTDAADEQSSDTEVALGPISVDPGLLDPSALIRMTVMSNEVREALGELEPTATFPDGELRGALVDDLFHLLGGMPDVLLAELHTILGPAPDPAEVTVLELRLRARQVFGWTNALLQALQNELSVQVQPDSLDAETRAEWEQRAQTMDVSDPGDEDALPEAVEASADGGYL